MALPTCWHDLEGCLVTTFAMESAAAVLADETTALSKQKQLHGLIGNAKLDRAPFECIFTDLEDGMDEAEVASCAEVWTQEVATAAEDAAERLQFTIQSNSFEQTDVAAATAWVKSSADVVAQQAKIAELGDDAEAEATQNAQDTLVTMQGTLDTNLQLVHKARRAKQLKDRKNMLSSPKRSSLDGGNMALGQSPVKVARSDSEPGEMIPPLSSLEALQSTETNVQAVLDGMVEDATVTVKLLYVPHGISRLSSSFNANIQLDLYETRIAANGCEYTLTAKGEVARRAHEQLAALAGRVMRVSHTKHEDYKGEAQLALMEDFQIEVLDSGHDQLRQEVLKRVGIGQLIEQPDKARVSLQTCVVNVKSESKLDKNGQPYRATRLVDVRGMVTNAMVWGDLATKPDVWNKDAVVEIAAAGVNMKDGRIDLRSFSQVLLASQSASFRVPTRLAYVKWP